MMQRAFSLILLILLIGPAYAASKPSSFKFLRLKSSSGVKAPLVIEPGLLTPASEDGAIEFDGNDLYITKSGVKTALGVSSAKGEKGDKGDTGERGPRGLAGPSGPSGPTGATGPAGSFSGGNATINGTLSFSSTGRIQNGIFNGTNLFRTNSIAKFNGSILIPASAANGKVLTSNGGGLARWQTIGSVINGANLNLGTRLSGITGALQFSNGVNLASDATNLFWDDTNNRLGIGTNSPVRAKTKIVIGSAAEQGLVLQAAASQTGNLTEWRDNASNINAKVTSAGQFADTGTIPNGTRFGGNNTFYTGGGSLEQQVLIGDGISSLGPWTTVVGSLGIANIGGVAIGKSSYAGPYCVSIGAVAGATGTTGGVPSGTAFTNCTVINSSGGGIAPTANNQLIIAGPTEAYFGKGVTHATPGTMSINATGGSGTDIAGGSIILAGGKGTGSAAGGAVIFQTSNGAASGTTLRTLRERMRINANGTVMIAETMVYDAATTNTSASNVTIDWNAGNRQEITLGHNVTFTFTNPAGVANLTLFLTQDATGSRTVTWPASVHWAGGTTPTLTSTASKMDIISCIYRSSVYYCQAGLNFTP